jgi:DNA polymerase-3 subunit delta'
MPNEAARRVMILADAQNMLPPAQNALLKILEEPPRSVLFILICENRTQLLETIRSRCVCVTMEAVDWEEAAPVLRAKLPRADEQELYRAYNLFGGRIGRVIDGMQDGTFRRVLELTPQFAEAIIAPTELALMRLTGMLEKDKELTAGVLAGLSLVLRDALTLSYGGQACLSTAPEVARTLTARLSGKRLMAISEQLAALQQAQRRNMNNTLFLTRMSACLREAAEAK